MLYSSSTRLACIGVCTVMVAALAICWPLVLALVVSYSSSHVIEQGERRMKRALGGVMGEPCIPPPAPEHGDYSVEGRDLVFRCDPMYRLKGAYHLSCGAGANWDNPVPTCEAERLEMICGNPGTPRNGKKDGAMYKQGDSVSFTCYRGYQLVGSATITCQTNGMWDAELPDCEPCPLNTYMVRYYGTDPGVCIPCPANSHTLTLGCVTRLQCVCDEGYSGEPGGPCTVTQCPSLSAPKHGYMEYCYRDSGGECQFSCDEGYVIKRGSSKLSCDTRGRWQGYPPVCGPCMVNTYKDSERSCSPCPHNSHTDRVGSTLDDCVCDVGYQGYAGQCTDIDECSGNDGLGPCQQRCINQAGGYECECTIPGYSLDPDDPHICIEEHCRELTSADIPEHAGLVCYHKEVENSIFCSMKCDPGYEHVSRVNYYEYCGPQTSYIWSFQTTDINAYLNPSVKEFFPGLQFGEDRKYFKEACSGMSVATQEATKAAFLEMLKEQGVCRVRSSQSQECDTTNAEILCSQW